MQLQGVLDQFPRVGVLLDQVGFETALKQVPASAMPPVEPDTVRGLQPPRRGAQIGAGRLQQQVKCQGTPAKCSSGVRWRSGDLVLFSNHAADLRAIGCSWP